MRRDVGLDPECVASFGCSARVGHGGLADDEHRRLGELAGGDLGVRTGHAVEVAADVDDAATLEVGAVPRRLPVERQVELEDAAAVPETADTREERRS